MDSITTKAANWRAWRSGVFGTRLRAWRTFEQWHSSGFVGLTVIRILRPASHWCIYNLDVNQTVETYQDLIENKQINPLLITFNEAAPYNRVILQGEMSLSGLCPYYLAYSTVKAQMRDALASNTRYLSGPLSLKIVKDLMTGSSQDDFDMVVERWPEHVVEFSIYECCVGDKPDRNTLVWEVRRY